MKNTYTVRIIEGCPEDSLLVDGVVFEKGVGKYITESQMSDQIKNHRWLSCGLVPDGVEPVATTKIVRGRDTVGEKE